MIDIKTYMKNVNVTKTKYVYEWIEKGLIPGVVKGNNGELLFPESARRPYRSRCKPNSDAKSIRGAIVKACIKRQQITPQTFYMSKGEFDKMIHELEDADLISEREEDGVLYYDSTPKCDEYASMNRWKFIENVNHCVIGPVISCVANVASTLV